MHGSSDQNIKAKLNYLACPLNIFFNTANGKIDMYNNDETKINHFSAYNHIIIHINRENGYRFSKLKVMIIFLKTINLINFKNKRFFKLN